MANPVYNAVNKPMLVFCVSRECFMGLIVVGAVIFWFLSLVAATALFGALFVGVQMATREDRQFPQVILARLRLADLYDSADRR